MDQILYEVRDRVAIITLNRPEKANAQTMSLLDDLDAAWTRAANDEDVRVIVLRGNGKHFSSGHDLNSGMPIPEKITLDWIYDAETRKYLEYCLRWRNVPKPSIASVQGKCIAGGLLLVILGLNLMGVLRIPLLARVWAPAQPGFGKQPLGGAAARSPLGALALGSIFALGWTPAGSTGSGGAGRGARGAKRGGGGGLWGGGAVGGPQSAPRSPISGSTRPAGSLRRGG